jgi:hypothetical protein
MAAAKGWTVLPRKGNETELDSFMQRHSFSCSQVKQKFDMWRDVKTCVDQEMTVDENLESHDVAASFLDHVPAASLLLKALCSTEVYKNHLTRMPSEVNDAIMALLYSKRKDSGGYFVLYCMLLGSSRKERSHTPHWQYETSLALLF